MIAAYVMVTCSLPYNENFSIVLPLKEQVLINRSGTNFALGGDMSLDFVVETVEPSVGVPMNIVICMHND